MRREMSEELRELYQLKQEINDHVDLIEGDLWGNSVWFSLMSRVLKHGDSEGLPISQWPQTITWDADELRELLKEIEGAMVANMMAVYLPLMGHLNDSIKTLDI